MPLHKGGWLDGVTAGAGGGARGGGGGRRYEAVLSVEEKEEEEGALGGVSGGRKAIETGVGYGGSTVSGSTVGGSEVGGSEVGLAGTPAASAAAAAARATVVLPSTPLPAGASSLSLLSRGRPLQAVFEEEEEEEGFDGNSSLSNGEKRSLGVEAEGRWGDGKGTVPPPAAAATPRPPPLNFVPFETESGGPSGSRSGSPPSGSGPPGSRYGSRSPPFGAAAALARRALDVMAVVQSWLVWPLLVLMLCTALLLVLAKVRGSSRGGSDGGVCGSSMAVAAAAADG